MTVPATASARWEGDPQARRRYLGLIRSWVWRDIRARYGRSALAASWAFAQPLAVTGIYCFIFGVIFDQSGGEVPYLSYFLAGMLAFRPIAGGLTLNTSLSDNHHLLGHLSFPREILPISQALGGSIELLALAPTLVVVAWVQGIAPTPMAILLIPILAVLVCLSAAVCIVASTIQVFVRDLQFAAVFVAQALFFATPISYQPDQAPAWMQTLNVINPIAVFAEAIRDVTLLGQAPDWPLVGVQGLAAVGLLVGAVAHLRSVGHRIVDLG